ncbi:hypothetical protein [Hoeflea sp. TYP-13]|uniref:hypothetical protein n=1 Tax=Hoeflea sp. TYP-13 TaxID=3230023 RepID=UPI0034C6783C
MFLSIDWIDARQLCNELVCSPVECLRLAKKAPQRFQCIIGTATSVLLTTNLVTPQNTLSRHSGKDVHIHGVPDHADELQLHYEKSAGPNGGSFEMMIYRGVEITKTQDGHCFAAGRVFATEADAKRYIVEIEREV